MTTYKYAQMPTGYSVWLDTLLVVRTLGVADSEYIQPDHKTKFYQPILAKSMHNEINELCHFVFHEYVIIPYPFNSKFIILPNYKIPIL